MGSAVLTLQKCSLGGEVEALVEQLGPLLAQVIPERPDTAVENAATLALVFIETQLGKRVTYRPSIEMWASLRMVMAGESSA